MSELAAQKEIEYAQQKDRIEGKEEGEKSKAIEIAKNLLKAGLETNVISDATVLSKKEIEDLKKNNF